MADKILYEDKLIKIKESGILLYKYFLPFKKTREIWFSLIEKIVLLDPTLTNGKYRFSGTGNFKDWFPQDFGRNKRDVVFRIFLKNMYWRICFTVEDSKSVIELLKKYVNVEDKRINSIMTRSDTSG